RWFQSAVYVAVRCTAAECNRASSVSVFFTSSIQVAPSGTVGLPLPAGSQRRYKFFTLHREPETTESYSERDETGDKAQSTGNTKSRRERNYLGFDAQTLFHAACVGQP